MLQPELLKKVINTLNELGIDYMLTGSVVSSLQGVPRATHDVDILVHIPLFLVSDLAAAFPMPRYFLQERSILEALERVGMFNLIDVEQGDKVDFWVLSNIAFDQSRFSRRYSVVYQGLDLMVSTPEDTILAKLSWAKLAGGSEKQMLDVLRVYEVQAHHLDLAYVEAWVNELDLQTYWREIKARANS
jgi:hypothetical protein